MGGEEEEEKGWRGGVREAKEGDLLHKFRGKVPGKGTGKGRDRERGRVMEGGEENKGWKGGEGREGRLAPWVQGETPPFNSSKQTKFFLRFGTTHYVR